jgi:hypothetical protein
VNFSHLSFASTDTSKSPELTFVEHVMATKSDVNIVLQHDVAIHDEPKTISANAVDVLGFEADEADLPKGYFRSRFFLGSYLAIGLGLWGGTAALYVLTAQ